MAELDPWAAVDPLGEALHFLRMTGAFYCRSELTAPWGMTLPAMPRYMWFHVVTAGRCWLDAGEAEPLPLEPGHFALVPHGKGHRLASAHGVDAPSVLDLPREEVSERYEILRHGGGGAPTTLVCGAVRFDHPAAGNLVPLLPAVVHVAGASDPAGDWMQSTLRLMAAEARALRPGGETVITRLADVLVVQAIRAWIEREGAGRGGWLGALGDRQIGRAIALIHRHPARDWTLHALAREVAMSRSAFAARFTALVGEPAMRYLTRWRMHLAHDRLRFENVPVGQLAGRLGYESEAAFSRAFKRIVGVAPGSVARGAAVERLERRAPIPG